MKNEKFPRKETHDIGQHHQSPDLEDRGCISKKKHIRKEEK
jgi:hypothetical protein